MRIMLVDDEPIFLYHLKEIIQSCCEQLNYEVEFVSECYSAERAIGQIPETLPDLIFTDIRMNAMDGLELAQRIREEWPFIKVIIVSGYPSFDYARSALRANVVDYLVKPIEPQALQQVLAQTIDHMNVSQYQRHRVELQSWIEQGEPSSGGGESILNLRSSGYGVIVVNSSEFQFNPLLYDSHMGIQTSYVESVRLMLDQGEDVWLFPNANKKGLLFVITLQKDDPVRMKSIAQYLLAYYSTPQSYAIAAISPLVEGAASLRDEIKSLLRSLDHHQVIGRNILLMPGDREKDNSKEYTSLTDVQEKTINYLSNNNDWQGIRELVQQLFEVWEAERCPSVYIEMNLRRIANAFGGHINELDPLSRREMEQYIQELLFASSSFTEAGDAFVDWLQSIVKPSNQPNEKKSEALFYQIQQYIAANWSEPLNLQILTEEFHISSTYLCNLFRIYCSSSFLEYFTDLRIQKAKELLQDHREIPIKDISEMVGYTDRHYFSKVFKSITGLTPSEFRSQS
ncbi:MAG: response regulator [Candidatus Pristimantibacillus sp.]